MNIIICDNYEKELNSVMEDKSAKIFTFSCSNCQSKKTIPGSEKGISLIPEETVIMGGNCLRNLTRNGEYSNYFIDLVDNCFHRILNKSLVDDYILKGHYLISSGWLMNWTEHIDQMGFDRESAIEFWAQFPKEIILLKTTMDKTVDIADEFSKFLDKKIVEVYVGLDVYEKSVNQIIADWKCRNRIRNSNNIQNELRRELADYQLAFDIIPDLIKSESTEDVINEILKIISILSGCRSTGFIPRNENVFKKVIGIENKNELINLKSACKRLYKCQSDYIVLKSGTGFIISLRYHHDILGYLIVQDVMFPEYISEYSKLIIKISSLCSFLIMNVRVFEEIKLKEEIQKINNTKLTDAYRELQKVYQLKDSYIAKISHEIRNPISGIISLSDLLHKNVGNDAKSEQMVTYIKDAANHLLYIIDDLLSFEQYSRGQLKFIFNEFTFENILSKIINSNSELLESNEIEVEVNVTPENFRCYNDENRIQQIIENIFINAVKYSGSDKICINVAADDKIKIEIIDHGIGIPENELEKIFEPFYRISNELQGSGLGLAIVEEIISAMGGTISVESRQGEGSLFLIILNKVCKDTRG